MQCPPHQLPFYTLPLPWVHHTSTLTAGTTFHVSKGSSFTNNQQMEA